MPSDVPNSIARLDQAFSRPTDGQLPLHAKVYRGLRYAIENFYEDGDRFFTEKELIEYLKVSQVTVRRAVYDLVTEGMLDRRVAKGTFVRKAGKPEGKGTYQVAIHVADWDSSFLSMMLRHILGAVASRKLGAKVFYSRQSGVLLSQEGETWDQAEISAAILISLPSDMAIDLTQRYRAAHKTVVAVDNPTAGEGAHFVGTDNLATVKLALDHLSTLGHERICLLLNEPEDHENVRLRAEFFEAECKRRKLSGWSVIHCGTKFWENSYDKAYKTMPRLMALDPRPTAIFAFDDPGAWAALKWCAKEGIRVPEDLSVLGFANDKPSAYTHPGLTTIAHPIAELATTSVDLLSVKSDQVEVRLLTPSLVVRESTGPCA